jgi:Recombinational DNA repair ATPase (RecF pathway)
MKIKSIKIDAFRGIPQNLELDLQGKSLLLLGENGTGKSSIIDAIEFFFTGKISHLKSKGTLSLNEYGPNTKNPDKASVGIEFKSGAHFTSRTFSSNPSFPKNFNENIELAKNGKFILRRSQILNLINTTPAQRYAFISEIIGANELEKTSTAMDQAKKYLDDEVRKIENNIKKNNDDIKISF